MCRAVERLVVEIKGWERERERILVVAVVHLVVIHDEMEGATRMKGFVVIHAVLLRKRGRSNVARRRVVGSEMRTGGVRGEMRKKSR